MPTIKTEQQYKAAYARMEELLRVVDNETLPNDRKFLELDLISDLVAEYEEYYFPVKQPRIETQTFAHKKELAFA
ncbi:MAG: XRE family transcriptional regulator [Prevotellaceae bacterium]|jgi:HTH-type transcriptional regulator/antitoxin HigA|nr:XRE family transcriptional regulator [Prevotellaceae bacterium]